MTERQDPFITKPEDLCHLLKQVIDTTHQMQAALIRAHALLEDIQNHAHDLRITVTTHKKI